MNRLPENTSLPKNAKFSATNRYRFYRSYMHLRSAHFISDWLMLKIVKRDWLMELRGTGYRFDKTNGYKRMKRNNDDRHGWRMPYGRCGRCHTNFALATPTFCPFIIIGHTNFDLLVNPISGRLLVTPISGKGGCLGPPLISRVLTGRFLKFKRHSIRLNMIYISKKEISKIRRRGY